MSQLKLQLIIFLLISSCTFRDDPKPMPSEKPFNKIYLSFKNFKPLTNGSVYEGWVLMKGKNISTGKFYFDTTGNVYQDSISVGFITNALFTFTEDISSAERFFITLENLNDQDAIPSSLIIASGNFSQNQASCSTLNINAINLSFNLDSSTFILGTQTSIPTDRYAYGLWFALRDDSLTIPSLNLPVLTSNSNWVYESWLKHETEPEDEWYSMGRFINGKTADSSKIPSQAPNQVPKSYPGEDFIYNDTLPVNNGNFSVLITLEPVKYKSSKPFFLKLFNSDIPYVTNYKDTTFTLHAIKNEDFPSVIARISQ